MLYLVILLPWFVSGGDTAVRSSGLNLVKYFAYETVYILLGYPVRNYHIMRGGVTKEYCIFLYIRSNVALTVLPQ
jgi:hypothetical protein